MADLFASRHGEKIATFDCSPFTPPLQSLVASNSILERRRLRSDCKKRVAWVRIHQTFLKTVFVLFFKILQI